MFYPVFSSYSAWHVGCFDLLYVMSLYKMFNFALHLYNCVRVMGSRLGESSTVEVYMYTSTTVLNAGSLGWFSSLGQKQTKFAVALWSESIRWRDEKSGSRRTHLKNR